MLLLDTHALIWLMEGSEPLGRGTSRLADRALADDELAVASISFWEIAMLADRGRILLDMPVARWRLRVLAIGLDEIPLTGDLAIGAAGLVDFHPDPADRIIVATGMAAGAVLATADDRILGWSGQLERHDARR